MTLPLINQRIKELINFHANGSVKKFSELIELNSSQVLNRIFNLDKRNQEYPSPSSEILLSIANKFEGLNCNWLLTGKGEMYESDEKNITITDGQAIFADNVSQYKGKNNTLQKSGADSTKEIELKDKEIEMLRKTVANHEKTITQKDKMIERYEKMLDQ